MPTSTSGADAAFPEIVRQLIGALVQLAIAQRFAFGHNRGQVRRLCGLPLEQFVDADIWIRGEREVPLVHDSISFVGAQNVQLRNAFGGIRASARQ